MDMIYDFHTHTCLTDGVLSPLELVRRACINGYRAIGITDHVGIGYLQRLIREITADCMLAQNHWNIIAIPGVELTHLPPSAIAETARQAKEMGARIVVVHGETPSEPVEAGTNLAALKSPDVDILAHPGFITLEEARLAAANNIYLEITARNSHSQANKHVADTGRLAGVKLIVNSDAHNEHNLLTYMHASSIAKGAGLSEDEIKTVLTINPMLLLKKLSLR